MMQLENETLDPSIHSGLRRRISEGYLYAKTTHMVPVGLSELEYVTASVPVVFVKNETSGAFEAFAVLGLEEGENLLVAADGSWQATYAPKILDVYPFALVADGNGIEFKRDEAVISETEGEALFDASGAPSSYFSQVKQKLGQVSEGTKLASEHIGALAKHRALKPIAIRLAFRSGRKHTLQGFYIPDRELLEVLDDAEVGSLHRSGALHFASLCSASLSQVTALIQRKNQFATDPIMAVQLTAPDAAII